MSDWRELFNMPPGSYLLNHSIGLLPSKLESQVRQEFFQPWAEASGETWPRWLRVIENFRRALSQLLGGAPQEFCPQVNVSSGLSKLLGALPPQPGRRILLLSRHDFPSAGFCLKQAERYGYSLRFMPDAMDSTDPGAWAGQLGADVRMVLISHVHYQTSTRVPVAEITAMCRERGIFSVVDIAQSAGVIPITLSDWSADAVVGSCIKWLCGGPGAGFLWIHAEQASALEPLDVGWFSHRNPMAFDIEDFEYADQAARFWGGTPSVLPYAVATGSILTMLDIGVPSIREHNLALSRQLMERLPADVLLTPDQDARRGGTLVIRLPRTEEFSQALEQQGVHHDQRNGAVRLSPHIYNTSEDIQNVIRCLPR